MCKMTRVKITGEITYDATAIEWCLPPLDPTQPTIKVPIGDGTLSDPRIQMHDLLGDMNRPSFNIRISYNLKVVRSVPMLNSRERMVLIPYVVQGKEAVSMNWITMLVRSLRQCGIVEEVHVYDVESNEFLQVPGFEQEWTRPVEVAADQAADTARSGGDGIVPVIEQAAQVTTGGAS